MAQEQQILEYLETHDGITQLDALNLFNCFRLSGRIYYLKQQGHNITMELVGNGKKKWAKYSLVKEPQMRMAI